MGLISWLVDQWIGYFSISYFHFISLFFFLMEFFHFHVFLGLIKNSGSLSCYLCIGLNNVRMHWFLKVQPLLYRVLLPVLYRVFFLSLPVCLIVIFCLIIIQCSLTMKWLLSGFFKELTMGLIDCWVTFQIMVGKFNWYFGIYSLKLWEPIPTSIENTSRLSNFFLWIPYCGIPYCGIRIIPSRYLWFDLN